MNLEKELGLVMVNNLRLKAKIMVVIFSVIFIAQMVLISASAIMHIRLLAGVTYKTVLIVPAMVSMGALLQMYAYRYFGRLAGQRSDISKPLVYILAFVEVSFPTILMFFVGVIVFTSQSADPGFLLSSPPAIMYFLFIMLSAFTLDASVCCFSGIIGALEYLIFVAWFLHGKQVSETEFPNNIGKAVIMAGCGVVAGLVSAKIKEAVLSSLQSKNDLISRLDVLVTEKTEEISLQKEEILEKNKDITDSINYAKRIQQSILPKNDFVRQLFPNSFVLYRPKDIVSGDFYWAGLKSKKKIIAAVDCTGHGVPGAFMSMVGSSLLNEVVLETGTVNSAEILNLLREKLIRTLQQTGAQGESKDGMDISLCVLDGMDLEFSGANNPMYLIRRGELIEYKGDKQPIGIHSGNNRPFAAVRMQLEAGDRIFIFTDGYADQFGGPKGKKFMYKRLQENLLAGARLEMSELKATLEKDLNAWRGNLDQVDDICIIGIEI
jgi:serine phosphatase RsbU (regulator of sigma subunit)